MWKKLRRLWIYYTAPKELRNYQKQLFLKTLPLLEKHLEASKGLSGSVKKLW